MRKKVPKILVDIGQSCFLYDFFSAEYISVTEEEYLEQSQRDVKRQNGSDFKTNKQQDVINKCGTRTSWISELI